MRARGLAFMGVAGARGFGVAWLVVVLLSVLGFGFVWVSVAFAEAPEVPEVSVVVPVGASSASFVGVLDPGKEGGPGSFAAGTYEFLYRRSASGCEGAGRAPASPGISLGGGHEEVTQMV